MKKTNNDLLIPFKKEGKWGFSDCDKNIKIPCIYENVDSFYEGFAEVSFGYNKVGIINKLGEVVVPLEYQSVSLVKDDSIFIVKNELYKYGLYKNGKLMFDVTFDYISTGDNYITLRTKGKWLVSNLSGEIQIFDEEMKSYSNLNGNFQNSPKYLSKNICIHEYYGWSVFINGIKKELYFIIDEFRKIETLNRHFFYGYRKSGKAYDDELGAIVVYDENFNVILPTEELDFNFMKIITQSEKLNFLIFERYDYKTFIIDENFQKIKELEFQISNEFKNGLVKVSNFNEKTKLGYINTNLELVIDCSNYQQAFIINDSLIKVKHGEVYGIIDYKGNEIIPLQYFNMGKMVDGICAVTLSKDITNSCCFINLHNEIISEKDYTFYYGGPSFDKNTGLAIVNKAGIGNFIINKKGEVILSPLNGYQFDNWSFSNNHKAIKKNKKFGLINTKGDISVPFIYDKIYSGFSSDNNRFWRVFKDNIMLGYIDNYGNQFWE
jgi:hypothetical protein